MLSLFVECCLYFQQKAIKTSPKWKYTVLINHSLIFLCSVSLSFLFSSIFCCSFPISMLLLPLLFVSALCCLFIVNAKVWQLKWAHGTWGREKKLYETKVDCSKKSVREKTICNGMNGRACVSVYLFGVFVYFVVCVFLSLNGFRVWNFTSYQIQFFFLRMG